MVSQRFIGALAAAGVALGVVSEPARAAEDPAIRAQMEQLERKQEALQAEMQELRKKLEAAPPAETKVVEVERKQNVITEEVRKIREALALPETKELKSEYGLGPAASKVYGVTRGVSLGSYGEFNYKNVVSDKGGDDDEFDFERLVLYTGYKFNDTFVFNSEIEFEHILTGGDSDGEVHVEFANLDVLLDKRLNIRSGLMLIPMGFLNEMHEPPFYHGNQRPIVEDKVIPSTWSAGGVGIFGELLPGLTYRTYAVTGLDASGFNSGGIRGGRQESIEKAEDFAWVGRIDYSPLEMLTIGGSAYVGDSGQHESFGNDGNGRKADVFTQIYEAHGQLRTHGFEARLLGAWVEVDDAALLSSDEDINPHKADPDEPDQPVASSQFGWYGEIAYNVLPLIDPETGHYLAPWFRYSHVDTQSDIPSGFDKNHIDEFDVFEVGLTYKPIPQVVFKLDYRNQDPKSGELPDEVRIGAGFVY